MNYDFNVPVLTLEGTPMKESYLNAEGNKAEREVSIGKILATQLAASSDTDPLKMMSIAKKMYSSTVPIELDESDKRKVEEFINNNKTLVNLVRAQALEVLSNPIKR